MLHLFYSAGSKVNCIHAVKAHLDLMMGTILELIAADKPLFSFEATEVGPALVKRLLDTFDFCGVTVRITESSAGEQEEISREL